MQSSAAGLKTNHTQMRRCHQRCAADSAGVTSARVTPRRGARVRGVGSIVSTGDDIIPDQWRHTHTQTHRLTHGMEGSGASAQHVGEEEEEEEAMMMMMMSNQHSSPHLVCMSSHWKTFRSLQSGWKISSLSPEASPTAGRSDTSVNLATNRLIYIKKMHLILFLPKCTWL